MVTSKLASNCRTTIPKPVRKALCLRLGDSIAYIIAEDCVVITRAQSAAIADPFASFHEWASEADTKAYAAL
jgi:antitoxin PrlF